MESCNIIVMEYMGGVYHTGLFMNFASAGTEWFMEHLVHEPFSYGLSFLRLALWWF